ncbi:MAG: Uridylate kinase [Alphaproteobacteria bacterium MarineAlpha2_Bin1]|nr:MAG: Uridylate kinase [Alphaproteobacteria bacterium MarineAlpha2_Bin1]
MLTSPKFNRVLLKVSGEALMGQQQFGIDWETVTSTANEISKVVNMGVQVCLVIGAGNIFRGASAAKEGMERSSADYMGMLATVINALSMQHALEKFSISTRVMSAIPMQSVCEPYIRRRGLHHLDESRVVIFAGGTGNPYFTTDTAAALRAAEMNCDVLLKGTQVDGVYESDPKVYPSAKKYKSLTYLDVLSKDLKVMDAAAITLARDSDIPIIVFSIHEENALANVILGGGSHTIINNSGST